MNNNITTLDTNCTNNSLVYSSNSTTPIWTPIESEYTVLGEKTTLPGSENIAIIIATLNVLGRPFYEELIIQGVSLPEKLIELIERRLVIKERDDKIGSIIED
jgi:hypothetical protein